MRPNLHVQTTREVETAAYVGKRVKDMIAVLKPCKTDGQRRSLLATLTAAAPERCDARESSGMIRRVSSYLEVRRDKRSAKQGGRPFAFDKAIDVRALNVTQLHAGSLAL